MASYLRSDICTRLSTNSYNHTVLKWETGKVQMQMKVQIPTSWDDGCT